MMRLEVLVYKRCGTFNVGVAFERQPTLKKQKNQAVSTDFGMPSGMRFNKAMR